MIMIIYIKKGFKCRNHCAPEVSRLSDQFVCFFFLPFSLCKVNFVCMVSDAFTPFEGVQGTVGFWMPRLGFRIPCTVHVFVDGTCYLDSSRWWDSAGARTVYPTTEPGRQESGFLYMGRYILQQQHLRGTSLRDMINMSENKDEP